MTLNYKQAHENAERIYQDIKDLPYSKAIKIVDLNEGDPEYSDSQAYGYVWATVRCKVNAKQKARGEVR